MSNTDATHLLSGDTRLNLTDDPFINVEMVSEALTNALGGILGLIGNGAVKDLLWQTARVEFETQPVVGEGSVTVWSDLSVRFEVQAVRADV